MSITAIPISIARDPAASGFLPVKLRRGNQCMILLYGFPSPSVRIALQRAGMLVGTVAPAAPLPGCVEQYDYVFIGPARERTHLLERALRDCIRNGWRPVAPPDAFRQSSAAA